MSSQRRIDASRANGALSQGPKTPQGRDLRDAANLTHGLNSRRTVLGHESEEEFRALRETYIIYFQPETCADFDLIDEFVAARWRLVRITSIETALFDLELDHQEPAVQKKFTVCDIETRSALAFKALCDDSRALGVLTRYEGRIRRTHDRLFKRLEAGRKIRENKKVQSVPNPINEHPAA
jgi:hypothetical protein